MDSQKYNFYNNSLIADKENVCIDNNFRTRTTPDNSDERLMLFAVSEASKGVQLKHGGPFGAVVVCNKQIVSLSCNTVIKENDATCHAEMNAIKKACVLLNTTDLSHCELFTTCEPCPMCMGAIYWAKIKRLVIGLNSRTAHDYGFDDLRFNNNEHFRKIFETSAEDVLCDQEMEVISEKIKLIFLSPEKYMKENQLSEKTILKSTSSDQMSPCTSISTVTGTTTNNETNFLYSALSVATESLLKKKKHDNCGFGVVIVKNNKIIASGYDTTNESSDITSTAIINAIRTANRVLGTYNLEGCHLYTTVEPDIMSLGAILWSRISTFHSCIRQADLAALGFEESFNHYKDFFNSNQKRKFLIERNVAPDDCLKVFDQWKVANGQIY